MADRVRSYHHHDLPAALLEAVDGLVREQGAGAVSLRAVARRVGVSHAAPAHHFGDKAGLLTAYAMHSLTAFRDQLASAGARAAAHGEPRLLAIGLAYVDFAMAEPGRFSIMFGSDEIDGEHPDYKAACEAAFDVLLDAVRELRPDLVHEETELVQAAAGAWSLVHGFAVLWLAGNLTDAIIAQPSEAAAASFGAFSTTLFMAAGMDPGSADLGPWAPSGAISPPAASAR